MIIPDGYTVTLKHSDGRPLRLKGLAGLKQPTTMDYLYTNGQVHSELWQLPNGRYGREGFPELPAVVIYYPGGQLCQELYYRGRTGQLARHVIYSETGQVTEDMDYSWKWTRPPAKLSSLI